jgi:osmotically inducible lipoprotein OsmB
VIYVDKLKGREAFMTKNTTTFKRNLLSIMLGVILVMGLSGCSSMTTRDKNTAIGAGVGAVAGAVLTGGSAWGTVGGAAVGGVIGNQVGRNR